MRQKSDHRFLFVRSGWRRDWLLGLLLPRQSPLWLFAGVRLSMVWSQHNRTPKLYSANIFNEMIYLIRFPQQQKTGALSATVAINGVNAATNITQRQQRRVRWAPTTALPYPVTISKYRRPYQLAYQHEGPTMISLMRKMISINGHRDPEAWIDTIEPVQRDHGLLHIYTQLDLQTAPI